MDSTASTTDRSRTMDSSTGAIVVFMVVALVCLVFGLAVQDWWFLLHACGGKGEISCPALTGGEHDVTLGTIVTAYVLVVESAAYAATAPGRGLASCWVSTSFALGAIGWLSTSMLHQSYPEDGREHDNLLLWALWASTLADSARLYAAMVAVKGVGKLQWLPNVRVLLLVTLGSALLVFALPLAMRRELPVVARAVAVGGRALTSVLFAVVGCVGQQLRWALLYFVSFAVSLALELLKPGPFIYSSTFSAGALYHTVCMVCLASAQGLFGGLAGARAAAAAMERVTNTEVDEAAEGLVTGAQDRARPSRFFGVCSCGPSKDRLRGGANAPLVVSAAPGVSKA
mmetsp:Transcript_78731/g.218765  ORF Transcript_78731/g.218765 Transcript_78731/m.218765 type:complete len:343 (-) Transcript_78731:85-1113(-)